MKSLNNLWDIGHNCSNKYGIGTELDIAEIAPVKLTYCTFNTLSADL